MNYQTERLKQENELKKIILEKIPKDQLLQFFQSFFPQQIYLYPNPNQFYYPVNQQYVQDNNNIQYQKPTPEYNLNNDNKNNDINVNENNTNNNGNVIKEDNINLNE